MKQIYIVEVDLDEEQDIKDILKEHDTRVQVRYTRFKSFDEYDDYRHYNDILGV